MRGVDDRRADRRLGLGVDEDRAARLEVANDVDVVDDLFPHVDRRAVVLERELHGLDGALDSGAIAAGGSEENALDHPDDRSLDHGLVSQAGDRARRGPAAPGGSSRQGLPNAPRSERFASPSDIDAITRPSGFQ